MSLGSVKNAQLKIAVGLPLLFSIFPFDPPENTRKPKVFLIFSGVSKGNIGKKKVNKTSFYYDGEYVICF